MKSRDPDAPREPRRESTSAASARDAARARAAATYDAAADSYDDEANSFWNRFGGATVARLSLPRGARVLDACCGSGASALAAAERAGPEGRVLGVDVARNLLARARAKAAARGLANAEFRAGDVLALDELGDEFDAVVCVFGIFFVLDMPAAVRSLWNRVRPGGRLAITTWGPRFLEPGNSIFWSAVREVRPELHKSFNPWDRITEPDAVRALLREGGVPSCEIVAEAGAHPIRSPEDWWTIVLGTGYRGTIEALTRDESDRVRERSLREVRERGVTSVEVNVVYAVARKAAVGHDASGM